MELTRPKIESCDPIFFTGTHEHTCKFQGMSGIHMTPKSQLTLVRSWDSDSSSSWLFGLLTSRGKIIVKQDGTIASWKFGGGGVGFSQNSIADLTAELCGIFWHCVLSWSTQQLNGCTRQQVTSWLVMASHGPLVTAHHARWLTLPLSCAASVWSFCEAIKVPTFNDIRHDDKSTDKHVRIKRFLLA